MNPNLTRLVEQEKAASRKVSDAEIALGHLLTDVKRDIDDANTLRELRDVVGSVADRIDTAQERVDEARAAHLEAKEAVEEERADPTPYDSLAEAEKVDADYLAARTLTIHGRKFYANEPIPPAAINELPPGRVKVLVDNRHLQPIASLAKA